jgi:hypothetical protein
VKLASRDEKSRIINVPVTGDKLIGELRNWIDISSCKIGDIGSRADVIEDGPDIFP